MGIGSSVTFDRSQIGPLPCASFGSGPPLLVIAGLAPVTGVDGDALVRGTVAPFERLARDHRVTVVNRRPRLPRGITFAQIAAEHADAIRDGLGGRADVIGVSTGGSLAQQLAADHPKVVGRLVLASTGCRLEGAAKEMQRRVAARIRGGAPRRAMAVMAADLVPPRRGRTLAAVAALVAGPRLLATDHDLDDLATTIEAEDTFDLARCPPIRARTLIVAGAEDRFYSRPLLEETARLIPGSELLVLDGRGHITALGDRRLGAALSTFLA
ncbi:MAG TPA: alpha/beta fold hydrolase [Solirubrobacteraceae bacterium]|nr:alpha/beta fold hydrolase [Solirubrobacteraceae bacterium]